GFRLAQPLGHITLLSYQKLTGCYHTPPKTPKESPVPFTNPAVRHLHWMCHAAQLLDSELSLDLAAQLTDDVDAILQHWDLAPENGPALLTAPAPRRLGLYFEAL